MALTVLAAALMIGAVISMRRALPPEARREAAVTALAFSLNVVVSKAGWRWRRRAD